MNSSNMITRLVPKKDTQQMIKALRSAKLNVLRDSGGMYHCDIPAKNKDGSETLMRLFTAMPGRNGYLIRMQKDLFTTSQEA